MTRYRNKTALYTLSMYKFYILIAFIFIAIIVGGQHLWPTVKFCFQWILSRFTGATEVYPNPAYQIEAMFFFSKTATAFLVGLLGLISFGTFFGPVLGFVTVTEELIDEKNARLKTLREHGEYLKNFNTFVAKAEQHQRSQLALMNKYDSVVAELNLTLMDAKKGVHDLNLRVKQLRAISAALGKELDGNIKPSSEDKVDRGEF